MYTIRDRGSDLVGIDMVKNYCLYKWYGRCSAKKGQKLHQIVALAMHETSYKNLLLQEDIHVMLLKLFIFLCIALESLKTYSG